MLEKEWLASHLTLPPSPPLFQKKWEVYSAEKLNGLCLGAGGSDPADLGHEAPPDRASALNREAWQPRPFSISSY